jgi:hypothetical protein
VRGAGCDVCNPSKAGCFLTPHMYVHTSLILPHTPYFIPRTSLTPHTSRLLWMICTLHIQLGWQYSMYVSSSVSTYLVVLALRPLSPIPSINPSLSRTYLYHIISCHLLNIFLFPILRILHVLGDDCLRRDEEKGVLLEHA